MRTTDDGLLGQVVDSDGAGAVGIPTARFQCLSPKHVDQDVGPALHRILTGGLVVWTAGAAAKERRASNDMYQVHGDDVVAYLEFRLAKVGDQPDIENQHIHRRVCSMNYQGYCCWGGDRKEVWGPKQSGESARARRFSLKL